MNEITRPPFSPRLVTGFVLIALGILFALDSFGVIDAGSLGDYWPLFLIVPGFTTLAWPRKHADRFWGAVLVAVGILFLLRNLDIVRVSSRHIWPVVLVALGIHLIWRALQSRREPEGDPQKSIGQRAQGGAMAGLGATRGLRETAVSAGDRLDEFAICGGGDRMVRSGAFRGGHVTAIMGGFDIDLRASCACTGRTWCASTPSRGWRATRRAAALRSSPTAPGSRSAARGTPGSGSCWARRGARMASSREEGLLRSDTWAARGTGVP